MSDNDRNEDDTTDIELYLDEDVYEKLVEITGSRDEDAINDTIVKILSSYLDHEKAP